MGDGIAQYIGIDVSRLQTDLRTDFTAVGRHPLVCLGAFGATLRLGDRSADVTVYVITGLAGVLISWFDSVALGILPVDFPAQIRHGKPPSEPVRAVSPSPPPPPLVGVRRAECAAAQSVCNASAQRGESCRCTQSCAEGLGTW